MAKMVLLIFGSFLLLSIILFSLAVYRVVGMPGQSYQGIPEPLSVAEDELSDRMRQHVVMLCAQGPRHLHSSSLALASDYIRSQLETMGYGVNEQVFPAGHSSVVNLWVDVPGSGPDERIIVVGAHYDTRAETPGADDNASAVAVGLELARHFKNRPARYGLRFSFFPNEESPFFGSEEMGSLQFARLIGERRDHVIGMFSLEMLGYYSDEPGSQRYPTPFSYFYPDVGNFLAFVGNLDSRLWVRATVKAFRQVARIPSEGMAAPSFVQDAGRSDHWAFWQAGIPALMITDTANFRNPNYHRPTDRPETLDYHRMALVTTGLAQMLKALDYRGP